MNYPTNLFKGITLAIATIALSTFLPEKFVYSFFAILLSTAGGIYIGFSIVDNKHPKEFIWEVIVSLLFPLLALVGIWKYPLAIAIGWALHGVWDLMHHLQELQTETGKSYPILCLIYDFIIAWYVFYYWVLYSPPGF